MRSQSVTCAIGPQQISGYALGLRASIRALNAQTGPHSEHRMKPFLFDAVFDVNTNLSIKDARVPGVSAVVIDDFLKHPDQARAIAGAAPAANWKHMEGGRNFVDYYDCRLRFPVWFPNRMIDVAHQAIHSLTGVRTHPQDPHIDVNWFMQIKQKRAAFAVPHHDVSTPSGRSFTCIVYLNSAAECSGGTAFFRFKPTGQLQRDPQFDAFAQQHPTIIETGRDYWLEDAGRYWERIGAIEMVPGRLVIFPSEFFHGADHPIDSYFDFPRMTLAFWMLTL